MSQLPEFNSHLYLNEMSKQRHLLSDFDQISIQKYIKRLMTTIYPAQMSSVALTDTRFILYIPSFIFLVSLNV